MESNKKKMISLIILSIIQISTAISAVATSWTELIGLKTLNGDFAVYKYVISSLYFSVGVLYLIGAINLEYRKAALLIACVDVILEIISFWVGFSVIELPIWLMMLFSLSIGIPGLLCFIELRKMKNRQEATT